MIGAASRVGCVVEPGNGGVRAAGPWADADRIAFAVPDPEHRLAGVRLLPELDLPAALRDFDFDTGVWRLELPPPPAARMEYRVELQHPDGGIETTTDPGEPALDAGRVRAQVGPGAARVRRAGLAGPGATVAGVRRADRRDRGRTGRGDRPLPRGGDPAAAARPRRTRVRRARRARRVRRRARAGRPATPVPAGPGRAGRTQRAVLGRSGLQRRAGRPGAAAAARDPRHHRPGGADGGQPGRAGGTAPAAAAPGPGRRPVPAVRQLLHPRTGRLRVRLPALRPDRGGGGGGAPARSGRAPRCRPC